MNELWDDPLSLQPKAAVAVKPKMKFASRCGFYSVRMNTNYDCRTLEVATKVRELGIAAGFIVSDIMPAGAPAPHRVYIDRSKRWATNV